MTSLRSSFPSLAVGLLAKYAKQGVDKSTTFISLPRPANKFACRRTKTKKMSNFFDISLLRFFCGKGGIRTPGTVTRTPHFECGPIDHSGTFPCAFCAANVRIYFLIPTILHNILHFFCVTSTIEDVFTNIFLIFVCTKRSILSFSI